MWIESIIVPIQQLNKKRWKKSLSYLIIRLGLPNGVSALESSVDALFGGVVLSHSFEHFLVHRLDEHFLSFFLLAPGIHLSIQEVSHALIQEDTASTTTDEITERSNNAVYTAFFIWIFMVDDF